MVVSAVRERQSKRKEYVSNCIGEFYFFVVNVETGILEFKKLTEFGSRILLLIFHKSGELQEEKRPPHFLRN